MKILKTVFVLTIASVFFISCSDDDDNPVPVNEEEVITTLIATLTAIDSPTVKMTFRDLDGDGPDVPVITVIPNLQANTVYNGSLDLLNETETPAESITDEIQLEDDDHQFFFSSTNGLVTTAYEDADDDGNPVGLLFTLTTATVGTDLFTVTLRHLPAKNAEGVNNGDSTNAGGETDVEVTFPIIVE